MHVVRALSGGPKAPRELAVAYLPAGAPRPAWLPPFPTYDEFRLVDEIKRAMVEHVDPKARDGYLATTARHHFDDGRPSVRVVELRRLMPGMARDEWGAWGDVVKTWRHESMAEVLRMVREDPPEGLQGASA